MSDYGLSAYVFTNDEARFDRVSAQLQAGCISHNGADYSHPANPFGGYKDSGLGRVGGTVGLQQCCQVKTISRQKTSV
jgi:aldehyde dehydrogenase (NAD+)